MSSPEFERFARSALLEVTDERSVGPFVGELDEGGAVTSVLFESNLPGYPGWKWSVSIARLEGAEPTVLESQLVPGDGALVAPDWVPWADRLEEYRAAQAAGAEAEAAAAELADVDDDDDDEDDDDDLGDDVFDGVDIDSIADSAIGSDDAAEDAYDDADEDAVSAVSSASAVRAKRSAVPAVGVDDSDETEPDARDAREEPELAAAGEQRVEEDQQHG